MNQITCVVITCDLSNLMQWILLGQNQNLTSDFPYNSFENCVPIGTQFIIQSFKTKCQTRYSPVPGSQCQLNNYVETSLSVNLGSMLHQTTKV